MDIRKIFVIYDSKKFTKDLIKQELKEEGYKHYFCFPQEGQNEDNLTYLRASDEVWVWGNCDEDPYLKTALDIGSDIWKMG